MMLRILESPPYRLGGRLTLVAERGAFRGDDTVRCEAIVEDGVAWPRALSYPVLVRSVPVPTSWTALRVIACTERRLVVELPWRLPVPDGGERAPTGFALAVLRDGRVFRARLAGGREAFIAAGGTASGRGVSDTARWKPAPLLSSPFSAPESAPSSITAG